MTAAELQAAVDSFRLIDAVNSGKPGMFSFLEKRRLESLGEQLFSTVAQHQQYVHHLPDHEASL